MKKMLFPLGLVFFCFLCTNLSAQNYWKQESPEAVSKKRISDQLAPNAFKVYALEVEQFKSILKAAPLRGSNEVSSAVTVAFPMADGSFQNFNVFEAPVFDAELSERYPNIKSYAGQSVDNPSEVIRFSVSPLGVKSMLMSTENGYEFIEPYSEDLTHYMVYQRKDRKPEETPFECTVKDEANQRIKDDGPVLNNADDGTLRTYRLVVSTTGEFTAYFGGTVAASLAAINATMTRVNGIYEADFNVTMSLISNTTSVIYTNASTDPYTGSYNSQLQSTLTSVIGEANYDIGHLFVQGSNNGNAGCIGCVCTNGSKGSAFTSHSVPQGDNFDVDYVAHEMGHQFGGNHTWTHGGNEGTNVQMEPGSGSTIMGYAGITGATDVQPHSDPYFHAITIEQITDYIKSRTCQTNTSTGNAIPTANAGADYTIPRGTPFILSGSGTDANGDALTYCWEQMDENNASSTYPSVTATTGVAFRSISPSTSTDRPFPALSTVLAGSTATTWEAVPNVARSLNFRLTVRDNRAGGGANESDNMVVTVNGTAGPFVVNSPNTNVDWSAGSSQTVTWDVAGTTGSPVSAANVNILLSTDGGNNFSTTLASNTPNDGSQVITVPNTPGTTNRIKVEAANNIFYDLSNTNFTISGAVACTATTPTGLSASGVGSDGATLNWNAVAGAASYTIRYRVTGSSTWTTITATGTSTTLSGLTALTSYEAQIRSVCPDNSTSSYSASVNFTTTEQQLNYCASNGNSVADEYISNVTLGSINNSSGASASGYVDYTAISTDLAKNSSNTISITPTWTGTVYSEGYSVWIDYNQNGDFTDAGEQVYTQAATQNTPVSGSFTVPASATEGNTRMRVSMKYNGIPTSCESFQYGEVEDYTVNITAGAPSCDTPTGLAISGITITSATASWNAATGAVTYDARFRESGTTTWNTANVSGTSRSLTGLTASTTYEVQVRTNCSGASSAYSSSVNFTTDALPTCDTPTGLAVSSITTNSATASWNAATGAVTYDARFRQTGTTPWTTGNITGTSASLTGLTASTTYEVQVRTNCSGASSAYSSSVNFTTDTPPSGGCSGGITAFPYTEGFESGLGAWTQGSGDDFDWSRRSGGTPSNNTGPSGASEGTFYMYTESSTPNYSNKVAIFNSPCFDLSAELSANFDFMYHMYGASNMGNLNLEASDDNGTSWTSIWSASGNQGNAWLSASVSLSAYIGGSVQVRFVGTTGTTWQGDMAIDDINLNDGSGPSCVDMNLTITFDNYPEETSWTLVNAGGTTVESGGTYGSQADGSTLVINMCVDPGCYDFTILDSYGDGICCSFGNGSYSLAGANGTVLASGGSFTNSELTNVCPSASTVQSIVDVVSSRQPASEQHLPEFAQELMLFPNPSDGLLTVQFQGFNEADGNVRVMDVFGKIVRVEQWNIVRGDNSYELNLSQLPEGTYFLEVNSGNETTVKRFVINH